jgi:hypothetical protein
MWSRREGEWAIDDRLYVSDIVAEYEVVAGRLARRPDLPPSSSRRDTSDPSYRRFELLRSGAPT